MTMTDALGYLLDLIEEDDADLTAGEVEAIAYAAAVLGMFVEALEDSDALT